MHFNNYQPERVKEQEVLGEEYSAEVISELQSLQQEANMGNDSGEISQISGLIEKFKNSEISGKEAIKKAHLIIYGKEAAIDQSGTHPNMGGH